MQLDATKTLFGSLHVCRNYRLVFGLAKIWGEEQRSSSWALFCFVASIYKHSFCSCSVAVFKYRHTIVLISASIRHLSCMFFDKINRKRNWNFRDEELRHWAIKLLAQGHREDLWSDRELLIDLLSPCLISFSLGKPSFSLG